MNRRLEPVEGIKIKIIHQKLTAKSDIEASWNDIRPIDVQIKQLEVVPLIDGGNTEPFRSVSVKTGAEVGLISKRCESIEVSFCAQAIKGSVEALVEAV